MRYRSGMDIYSIRLANLESLINDTGGIEAFCETTETNEKYVRQILNGWKRSGSDTPARVGARLARDIEAKCTMPPGWMDSLHTENRAESIERRDLYDAAALTMRHVIALQESINAMAASLGIEPSDLTDPSPEARVRIAAAIDKPISDTQSTSNSSDFAISGKRNASMNQVTRQKKSPGHNAGRR